MKRSILSIILLVLIISLTITVGSADLIAVYAIENYLQLRSANVNYHGGDIDVDIRIVGSNIPSENGNNGFGYAVLTDVGDESVDNVLVAISDIGIKNNDKSTKNDKLHTYVLDLTGDTSSACSGSDYEVTKSSSDNEGFDTNYLIDVKGNKISIDDVDTNDLASGTVKAIASFTEESITHNGKIKQICIDIQDVLKQSEINVDYNNDNNNDDNENENNDDHNNDDNKDKSRHKDNDKNRKDHDDDSKKDDNDDSLFEADIDQSIEQSNECNNEASCSNEANDEIDVFESENSGDDDEFDSNLDIDQSIEQSNECNNEASCSNEANDEIDVGGGSSDDSYIDGTDLDVNQFISQSNTCGDEADCDNEGDNEANLRGDISDNSNTDISQSIQQSNTCSGEATCSNFASNVVNIS